MSDKGTVLFDSEGMPILVKNEVLLSDVIEAEPDQEIVEEEPLTPSVKPEEVGWDEWRRRQNNVRTLAREYDEVDEGDVREFLEGKLNRDLSDDEVAQLKHDIGMHRLSDITDIFDNQLRSTSERLKRGRRTVRVSAPKGWTNRAFKSLDQRGVEQLCAHLISRGHDSNTIKDKVVSRVADEEVRNAITEKIDSEGLQVES